MESLIISIFDILISNQSITGIYTELGVALVMFGFYKFFLKPMMIKLKSLPTKEDLASSKAIDLKAKEELLVTLQSVLERLDNIDDIEKTECKEITQIKLDIGRIREVLNQFQGHMMYGNTHQSGFGNKELK